jgi:hypothetical protein
MLQLGVAARWLVGVAAALVLWHGFSPRPSGLRQDFLSAACSVLHLGNVRFREVQHSAGGGGGGGGEGEGGAECGESAGAGAGASAGAGAGASTATAAAACEGGGDDGDGADAEVSKTHSLITLP